MNERPSTPAPVERVHGLLQESIQSIAQSWIHELQVLRESTVTLENQLLACVADLKAKVEELHTLGAKISTEVKQGQDAVTAASNGLAKITD